MACRTSTSWRARAVRIASCCASQRRVLPSTSVNRNVTVPLGIPDARSVSRVLAIEVLQLPDRQSLLAQQRYHTVAADKVGCANCDECRRAGANDRFDPLSHSRVAIIEQSPPDLSESNRLFILLLLQRGFHRGDVTARPRVDRCYEHRFQPAVLERGDRVLEIGPLSLLAHALEYLQLLANRFDSRDSFVEKLSHPRQVNVWREHRVVAHFGCL